MESQVRQNDPFVIPDGTQLIETFGWHPNEGARRLDLHLSRMEESASELGFAFNWANALSKIDEIAGAQALRCRLTLAQSGEIALTTAPLGPTALSWRVVISPVRQKSDDFWLRHKTTQRQHYDDARASLPDGVNEVLFLNENEFLCEGTITNVFLKTGRGPWRTPHLAAGLLPGVLRQSLLASGDTEEADLTLGDLRNATRVAMGNSLRGLIPTEVQL